MNEYTQSAVIAPNGNVYVLGTNALFLVNSQGAANLFSLVSGAGLAITPDGVSCIFRLSIRIPSGSFFRFATNKVIAKIAGDGENAGGRVAISPDGAYAYFAGPSDVYQVSTATNTVIQQLLSPESIEYIGSLVATSTAVYATGSGIDEFLLSGTTKVIPTGGRPVSVQVDRATGNLVALQTLNRVLTADPLTDLVTQNLGLAIGDQTLMLSSGGNVVVGAQQFATKQVFSIVSTANHQIRQLGSSATGPFVVNSTGTAAYVLTGAVQGQPYQLSGVSLSTGQVFFQAPLPMFNDAGSPFIAIAPDNGALYVGADEQFCKVTLPSAKVSACAQDGNSRKVNLFRRPDSNN